MEERQHLLKAGLRRRQKFTFTTFLREEIGVELQKWG
jgi:hypothetical protein